MTDSLENDYGLGDKVTFSHPLHRKETLASEVWQGRWLHEWQPDPFQPTRPGVIVGRRTLSNGNVHYLGEDGTDYRPTEHFTAYLVAFDLRRKPVLVRPEHITPEVS